MQDPTPSAPPPTDRSTLRSRALELLDSFPEGPLGPEGALPGDLAVVLRELATYRVELELQNEDLRRANLDLDRYRRRFEDLYDFAPVGFVTTVDKSLVLQANRTLARLLGVERRSLLGTHLTDYILPEDQDIYYHHARAARAPGARARCELRIRAADGGARWVRIESEARGDEGPGQVRAAISDITSWMESEEASARLNQRLQQAQRLEGLGALAGGIAHDFNNLLTILICNLELARSTPPGPDQEREFERALSASDRAVELVQQLLAYAGQHEVRREPLDLGALTQGTADLVRPSLPAGATLEVEVAPGLPRAFGDATQLRQVALNLISNAAQALQEVSAAIEVRVSRRSCPAELEDALRPGQSLPAGDYLSLRVRDEGVGMGPGTLAHVFEPLFSTKGRGRGLGLASVSGIVRSHGGTILVESELGVGSTFEVLLPVHTEES